MALSSTDFKTIRLRYELLGDSLQDLAQEYSMSLDQITFLAKEEEWIQSALPTPQDLVVSNTPVDTETYAKSLLETTKHKLSILSVYNQLHLRPQYIELEHTLLAAAVQMAKSLKPEDPMSVSKLRTLTGVLNDLSSRLGLLSGAANEGEKMLKENGVSVQIVQQFLENKTQVLQ